MSPFSGVFWDLSQRNKVYSAVSTSGLSLDFNAFCLPGHILVEETNSVIFYLLYFKSFTADFPIPNSFANVVTFSTFSSLLNSVVLSSTVFYVLFYMLRITLQLRPSEN
jgi:hypothetical protein